MRLDEWLYRIPLRLRSLFHRNDVEQELDEELRDYVERQTEENRSRGMSPSEARRAALIALGGLEQRKQQCREMRGVHWIHDLGQDLLYGLRKMMSGTRVQHGCAPDRCAGDRSQHGDFQRGSCAAVSGIAL